MRRRKVRRRERLGRMGEWAALVWMMAKGYRPRHRRWRVPGGELDLVMTRGDTVVFVEVKTRSSSDFGGAAAAVNRAKRERMTRAAAAYLSRYGLWERPSRFDVVVVERSGGRLPWRLRHYAGAFRPDLGRLL